MKTEYSKGREAENIETETLIKKLQEENMTLKKENVKLKLKLKGFVWMPKDQEEEAKDLNEDESDGKGCEEVGQKADENIRGNISLV